MLGQRHAFQVEPKTLPKKEMTFRISFFVFGLIQLQVTIK